MNVTILLINVYDFQTLFGSHIFTATFMYSIIFQYFVYFVQTTFDNFVVLCLIIEFEIVENYILYLNRYEIDIPLYFYLLEIA